MSFLRRARNAWWDFLDGDHPWRDLAAVAFVAALAIVAAVAAVVAVARGSDPPAEDHRPPVCDPYTGDCGDPPEPDGGGGVP